METLLATSITIIMLALLHNDIKFILSDVRQNNNSVTGREKQKENTSLNSS